MANQYSSQSGVAVSAVNVSQSVQLEQHTINILDDVSLNIAAQSKVSIVGPSGSGKTTLLGLLAGLDRPTTGRIELLGDALQDLDEDRRANLRCGRVGFVFQSFHLLPNLTARENVALALEVVPGSDDILSHADVALEKVGLAQRAKHLPSQLSGGEQQRVALARAMITSPQILFADEPTGNLDHNTRDQVTDLLFKLCDDSGCTLVLVTHDSQLAAQCDSVFRLDAGRLVE